MSRRLVPVTHGAHRPLDSDDPDRDILHSWLSVLPAGTCYTHVTAAELWGLWLPPLPPERVLVAHLPADSHPVRRKGLRALRSERVAAPRRVRGLPVASVPDVVLSLCRDLDDLGTLMVVDSVLHRQLATRAELSAAATGGRHGAIRLRRVLALADHRTESPWETVLREFHRHVEAHVTPQHVVRDSVGNFVARGDLRLAELPLLHEYDGGVHRTVAQHRKDLARERRLQEVGWSRRGYTSQDLVRAPDGLLRDIDRSLGREHDLGRLDAWRESLRSSTLSLRGRSVIWPRFAS